MVTQFYVNVIMFINATLSISDIINNNNNNVNVQIVLK